MRRTTKLINYTSLFSGALSKKIKRSIYRVERQEQVRLYSTSELGKSTNSTSIRDSQTDHDKYSIDSTEERTNIKRLYEHFASKEWMSLSGEDQSKIIGVFEHSKCFNEALNLGIIEIDQYLQLINNLDDEVFSREDLESLFNPAMMETLLLPNRININNYIPVRLNELLTLNALLNKSKLLLIVKNKHITLEALLALDLKDLNYLFRLLSGEYDISIILEHKYLTMDYALGIPDADKDAFVKVVKCISQYSSDYKDNMWKQFFGYFMKLRPHTRENLPNDLINCMGQHITIRNFDSLSDQDQKILKDIMNSPLGCMALDASYIEVRDYLALSSEAKNYLSSFFPSWEEWTNRNSDRPTHSYDYDRIQNIFEQGRLNLNDIIGLFPHEQCRVLELFVNLPNVTGWAMENKFFTVKQYATMLSDESQDNLQIRLRRDYKKIEHLYQYKDTSPDSAEELKLFTDNCRAYYKDVLKISYHGRCRVFDLFNADWDAEGWAFEHNYFTVEQYSILSDDQQELLKKVLLKHYKDYQAAYHTKKSRPLIIENFRSYCNEMLNNAISENASAAPECSNLNISRKQ